MSPPAAAGQTGEEQLVIDHKNIQSSLLTSAKQIRHCPDDAFTRNSHLYIFLLSVNLLMIFITRKESANQLLDNEAPLGSISKMRNCCRFKVWEGLSGS